MQIITELHWVSCSQDREKGAIFSFFPEMTPPKISPHKMYKMMVFPDSKHWAMKSSCFWDTRNRWGELYGCPSVMSAERFQTMVQTGRTQVEPGGLEGIELGAKAARLCSAEWRVSQRQRERERSGSSEGEPRGYSVYRWQCVRRGHLPTHSMRPGSLWGIEILQECMPYEVNATT